MNERIRELAEQASHQSPDGYPVTIPYSKDFAEKFAELIVRECVNNLEIHSTCFDGDVGRGVKIAARLTKEHFGVEE
jgi:hypothetical protein